MPSAFQHRTRNLPNTWAAHRWTQETAARHHRHMLRYFDGITLAFNVGAGKMILMRKLATLVATRGSHRDVTLRPEMLNKTKRVVAKFPKHLWCTEGY